MSLGVSHEAGALPAVSPWRRVGELGRLLGRPFAGIPLVLGDPIYRPLFIFFLLIGLGAGLWLNFVPVWLAQDFGATPAQVGWFFALSFLGAAAGNFALPALAERVGSRKSVSVWALLSGFPCLVTLAFANGYWMALLSFVELWIGAGFFGLLLGMTGDIARERARGGERDLSGTVIAALQTAMALGGTAAPLLGGWLYEHTGQLRVGILLHALPAAVATWVLWRHVREERAPAAPPDAAPRPAAPVWGLGWALFLFLAAEVWFRVGDSRGPFETIYAAQELGASKAQVGLMLTILSALLLLLTPVMGVLTDRIGAGRTTMIGLGLLAAHALLLAGTTAFWQQLALLILAAAGLAIGSSAPFVYAQQLAPGRASLATGWLNACFFLGLALGSPLAGRVAESAGYRGLFVFAGVMDVVAVALVGLLVLGRERRAAALRALPD